jgi:carbon-monoxide dehydrogenase medium subunit
VQITLDDKGAVQKAGIGLTNVGGTPIRAKSAEDSLRGKKLDETTIGAAAQLAADAAQPSADLRGPVAYKKGLIKELTKRALARAAERAGK